MDCHQDSILSHLDICEVIIDIFRQASSSFAVMLLCINLVVWKVARDHTAVDVLLRLLWTILSASSSASRASFSLTLSIVWIWSCPMSMSMSQQTKNMPWGMGSTFFHPSFSRIERMNGRRASSLFAILKNLSPCLDLDLETSHPQPELNRSFLHSQQPTFRQDKAMVRRS